jgi:hypothetical protein
LHRGPDAPTLYLVSDQTDRERENLAQIAVLLALYDQLPELRQWITEPFLADDARQQQSRSHLSPARLAAMALSDPERTAAWHQELLGDLADSELGRLGNSSLLLAELLGSDGSALARTITDEVFYLWVIDKEDLR